MPEKNRTLIVFDDNKKILDSIADLCDAYEIDHRIVKPEIIYKDRKDVMTPRVMDVVGGVENATIILLDATFLSGVIDEAKFCGEDMYKEFLRTRDVLMAVLSGEPMWAIRNASEYVEALDWCKSHL